MTGPHCFSVPALITGPITADVEHLVVARNHDVFE